MPKKCKNVKVEAKKPNFETKLFKIMYSTTGKVTSTWDLATKICVKMQNNSHPTYTVSLNLEKNVNAEKCQKLLKIAENTFFSFFKAESNNFLWEKDDNAFFNAHERNIHVFVFSDYSALSRRSLFHTKLLFHGFSTQILKPLMIAEATNERGKKTYTAILQQFYVA